MNNTRSSLPVPRCSSPAQQPLPLDDSSNAFLLRLAFERSGLRARGWTFDRAMRTPAVHTCIKNTARAILMARARKARRAAHRFTDSTSEGV